MAAFVRPDAFEDSFGFLPVFDGRGIKIYAAATLTSVKTVR